MDREGAGLRADSPLATRWESSPNHEARVGGALPDAVILHYTGMGSGAAALRWLCEASAKVSCHYVVEEDGGIVQLVPEARRAWHAGRSIWAGETDINSLSIGIEIVNGGHDFGLPPFPDGQVAAVAALCGDIVARHGIRADRVLAHSDVAPGRKRDPGELFPWDRLHARGIGLWVSERTGSREPLRPGDMGEAVEALQQALADYGYGIACSGFYDEATRIVVEAFQRHFRRSSVDGVADASTQAALSDLLAARGQLTADQSQPRSAA